MLEHPFINKITEYYDELILEYMCICHLVVSPMARGGTLEETIAQRRNEDRPMQDKELLKLFAMVSLGMEETHSQG